MSDNIASSLANAWDRVYTWCSGFCDRGGLIMHQSILIQPVLDRLTVTIHSFTTIHVPITTCRIIQSIRRVVLWIDSCVVVIDVVILPIRIVAIEVPVIAGACFPAVKMGEASVVLGINSCVVVIVILGAHPLATQVIHVVIMAIRIVAIEVPVIAGACFPAVKMGEA